KEITAAGLYNIGTAALIQRAVQVSSQGYMVLLQGVAKIKATEFSQGEGFLICTVETITEQVSKSENVEALKRIVLKTAQKIIAYSPLIPKELHAALEDLADPWQLCYQAVNLVKLDISEQQKLLQLSSIEEKLKYLSGVLRKELDLLELGGKIQKDAQKEFSKDGREAFLREKMRQIKKELGEVSEEEKEAKGYEKKLKKAKLPKEAHRECEREIKRLAEMRPWAADYQVVRTYLDWVLELPWNQESKDRLSLSAAKKQLEHDHYGLKEPKERIIEYLAVRKLKKDLRGPILCFIGPPGVGKTSLGQSIAKALNRKFVRMSLGGMRDEAEIRGHRRTYVGALPGRIIQGIRRAGTKNPVFMLDEIDKVGADFRGDPAAALLEVLDPEQNKTFRDHYLDLDFDLSRVLFIATGNILEPIHPALRDRMEIIELAGYTEEEKVKIAEKYLWPRILDEHGLKKSQLALARELLLKIIAEYTREAGVRNLERELAKICRRAAKKIADHQAVRVKFTLKNLPEFLGPQKVYPETDLRAGRPGVVAGLAVTPAGGVIQFIEASKMPGKKGFTLTGQLGDVMKESAWAALSLIRSRAKNLKLPEKFFDKTDLHLHVPAGAVPKDGPSAGVAMTTALASLLTDQVVRKDVAMTGEITLSGLVLPIGGVKEKVLAAKRADINTVILPKRNENDIKEIDKELKDGLKFVYVQTIDDVLKTALDGKVKSS
ncbi:MAG: endopeptidase La, partial [Candidatus Cloacimonetes bacterium]|nr:endopeptidase La [Candidatus Cloacimonadota bacterium]